MNVAIAPQRREVKCPVCQTTTRYSERDEMFWCPGCKVELWPPIDPEAPAPQMRRTRANNAHPLSRFLSPDLTIYCPFCENTMEYCPADQMFRCPECQIELWPPDIQEEKDYRSAQELFNDMLRSVKRMIKHTGSRSSAKSKKQRPRRRRYWELE